MSMSYIRDTHLFARVQGFFEQLQGHGGRTHHTDDCWNEAYDSGMNCADIVLRLIGRGEAN